VIHPRRALAVACAATALGTAAVGAAAPSTVLWPGATGQSRLTVVASAGSGAAAGWTVELGTPDARPAVTTLGADGGWAAAVEVPGPRPAWLGGLGRDAAGGVTALLIVVPGAYRFGLTTTARGPDGAWGAPEEIVHPSADSLPRSARLVENARGDAALVWEQFGARSLIRASVRLAGESWRTPVDLERRSAPAHEAGPEPRVAIDARGGLAAVWERDGTVVASRGSVRGGWARPVAVTRRARSGFGPQVGFIRPGRPLVVWGTTEPNLAQGVQAAVGAAGARWRPERLPVVPRGLGGGSPVLATAPSGRAAVVWGRDVAQRRTLLVTTRGPDGAWRAPIALIAGVPLARGLEPPNVAVRGDGGTVVAYRLAGRSVIAGIAPDGTLEFRRPVGAGGAGVPVVAAAGRGAVAVWGRHGVVRALLIPPR
jgi:hypothetical protein